MRNRLISKIVVVRRGNAVDHGGAYREPRGGIYRGGTIYRGGAYGYGDRGGAYANRVDVLWRRSNVDRRSRSSDRR